MKAFPGKCMLRLHFIQSSLSIFLTIKLPSLRNFIVETFSSRKFFSVNLVYLTSNLDGCRRSGRMDCTGLENESVQTSGMLKKCENELLFHCLRRFCPTFRKIKSVWEKLLFVLPTKRSDQSGWGPSKTEFFNNERLFRVEPTPQTSDDMPCHQTFVFLLPSQFTEASLNSSSPPDFWMKHQLSCEQLLSSSSV